MTTSAWFDWTVGERRLWRRWTLANGVGEVVGLGVTGLAGVVLAAAVGVDEGPGGSLLVAAVLIGLGTVEGGIVGYAQWRAMRGAFPGIDARGWTAVTATGAFAAWTLGVLPGTLGSAGTPAGPPVEPSAALVLLLAALLGATAGLVLSGAQWLHLRDHATAAWRWLPANAAAWAVGMPVVFAGASLVPAGPPGVVAAVVVLGTAGAAGLVVGAIHGVALVWLAP